MTRIVFYILLCLSAITEIGCNKRLDNYDLAYSGDRLVLFGNISKEKGVTVYLTHTLPPTGTYQLDEIDVDVSGALIILFENGVVADTLVEIVPGNYMLDVVPSADNVYSLTASADGYESVFTNNIVFPQNLDVDSIEYEEGFENINGDPSFSVKPIFSDVPDIDNYYAFGFKCMVGEDYYIADIFETPDAEPLGCEAGSFVYDNNYNKVYSDNCFSGSNFPISFICSQVYHQADIISFDQCEFTVSSVSKELYTYLSTQSESAGVQLLFSDPKINYTNIENGFGVFWAQNDTSVIYHF